MGLFKDKQAKEFIKGIQELKDNKFVRLWLEEPNTVYSIITYDETKTIPICIALLHKIEFDPLHLFDKPLLLDYIYTMEKYRRQNHAYKLIVKIKKNNKLIGYCCNDESVKLFVKCGFSYHLDHLEMVRFPPLTF